MVNFLKVFILVLFQVSFGVIRQPTNVLIWEVGAPEFEIGPPHAFIEVFLYLQGASLVPGDLVEVSGYHLVVMSKKYDDLMPNLELVVTFQRRSSKNYVLLGSNLNSTVRNRVDYFIDMR